MTFHDYKILGSPKLKPMQVVLTTYDGGEMPSSGKACIRFKEIADPHPSITLDDLVQG